MTKLSEWFIVHLSYLGEQQKDEFIKQEIQEKLTSCEVFFPSHKEDVDGFMIDEKALPGYVFIKLNDTIRDPFTLENTRFFDIVITRSRKGGAKKLEIVDDDYIVKIKKKLRAMLDNDIRVDQTVFVTQGLYENMTGIVTRVVKDSTRARVRIELASKSIEADIPQICLKVLESE